jgi:hypothetical protein
MRLDDAAFGACRASEKVDPAVQDGGAGRLAIAEQRQGRRERDVGAHPGNVMAGGAHTIARSVLVLQSFERQSL